MLASATSVPVVCSLHEAKAQAQWDYDSFDPTRGNLRNPQVLRYTVRDEAIVGKNGMFYNNRPQGILLRVARCQCRY